MNEQLIAAAQQALEALDFVCMECDVWTEEHITPAITALRTAIEQAKRQQALDKKAENARELGIQMQPEPVTCAKQLSKELLGVITDVEEGEGFDNLCLDTIKYVYEQLATLPAAQRQWVGLEPDEILDALVSVDPATKRLPIGFVRFAKGIEAKLREKNGGAS